MCRVFQKAKLRVISIRREVQPHGILSWHKKDSSHTFRRFSVTKGKSLVCNPITNPNKPYRSFSSISDIIPKSMKANLPSGVLSKFPRCGSKSTLPNEKHNSNKIQIQIRFNKCAPLCINIQSYKTHLHEKVPWSLTDPQNNATLSAPYLSHRHLPMVPFRRRSIP